jgi:signal transduction histidine kinase/CheY-like chemotaxis protein
MSSEFVFGFENAAWPALLVDAQGSVLRANTAANNLFGAALSGDMPQLSKIWPPENDATAEEFLKRTGQSAVPVMNLKLRTGNGMMAHCIASVCAFNRDGRQWFVLQLLPKAALTALAAKPEPALSPPPAPAGETKAVLDANALQLKQKLDCALQLARTVSLDFNNALTSILGHTSFLLGKAAPGHPWRHSLIEVEKSAERAAEIANELQTFSRLEKEARRAPPGNLNTVVGRCVDFFRNASGAAIVWKLQLDKGLFGARFDEAKLQQALTKILENAVEAITGNGGQITVQTRNMALTEQTQDRNTRLAPGSYVCVEIIDNGCGIETAVLPRIFEPFFTTKGSSHRGLGLALAYGIISNHGGGVAVSGQPGKGTSVRIYLPAETQLAGESAGAGDNLQGSEIVLVVDDEALLLTMMETILTEFGYKILTAASGQKALAILSRDDTKVDLVVTDMVMPGMSGRELVERVRELSPTTRILCMSGYSLSADKQAGTPYLRKPFTSAELLAKVRGVITANLGVDE